MDLGPAPRVPMEPAAAKPKSSFVSRFLKKTAPRFLLACVSSSSEQKKKTTTKKNKPVVPGVATGGNGGDPGNSTDKNIQEQLEEIVPKSAESSQQMQQQQDPADEIQSESNEKTIVSGNDIERKYNSFKQFDAVPNFPDHFFKKEKVEQPTKKWAQAIDREWKILGKDLPEAIYVRICEGRKEIMRAAIVGSSGTPYHDGLFFFDIYFPPSYPSKPPKVHYWSHGLSLNPNLYASGKVCISILNTWSGKASERWIPKKSTILQVLVSIQALVLNARPYFNEPYNIFTFQKPWMRYSNHAFIASGKTMLFSLRSPLKNFEDLVAGHFHRHGKMFLVACRAYLNDARVGSVVMDEEGIVEYQTSNVNNIDGFKASLKWLIKELAKEFAACGVDCAEFLR